jgi:L,D-transpeptidase-like protein
MPAKARYRGVSPTLAHLGATRFVRFAILGAAAALSLSGCAAVHHEVAPSSRRPTAFASRGPSAFPPVEPAILHHSDDDDQPAPDHTYLLLRLRERRLYLFTYDSGATAPTETESFPVAIGRKKYETPTGVFAVTDKVEDPHWVQFDFDDPSKKAIRVVPPGPDNPLGRRWIGFASGYGWQIGFHGTPHPELLGQAVSHGCVRMRNDDVVKVYDHVRVGTPVIVEP